MSEQAEIEFTYVKTAPEEGERVGLSEKDPAHPKTDAFPDGGECYVAGQDQPPQRVAKTAGVLDALNKKRIVEVSAPRSSAHEASAQEPASAPPPDDQAGATPRSVPRRST